MNNYDEIRSALKRLVAIDDAHSSIHAPDGDDIARMVEYSAAFDHARAALAAAPDVQPKQKFDQAEFDEMVCRGTAAWAGVDTNNIYGDGDAQREQDRIDADIVQSKEGKT